MGKMLAGWSGEEFLKHVAKELWPARLERAGGAVRRRAQELIDAPKHGRRRYSKGARKVYISSAAGEATASPTGKVRNDIQVEVGEGEGGFPAVRIGAGPATKGIAKQLFLGTSRAAPRPTLEPALEGNAEVERALREGWGGAE